MISEELEFRLSQYADGTLPADAVAALEATLAGDPEARSMLESYRKLDAAIRAQMTTPAIDWDQFAAGISRAVAEKDRSNYSIPIWGRIGALGRLAIAAVIVLAIGGSIWFGVRPAQTKHFAFKPTTPRVELAEVTGPTAEIGLRPGIEDVSIGPSADASTASYAAAEDVVYNTPHVVIASSAFQRQDSAALPY